MRAYQDALVGTPMTVTKNSYEAKYLGLDDLDLFTTLAEDHNISVTAHDIAHLIDTKRQRYNELIGRRDVIFSGARKCIERLAGEVVLGIASGAIHQEIEDILTGAGLRVYFSTIVAADDVTHSKPDPETYKLAIELLSETLGRPPSPTGFVAVEDSTWGITSAKSAGLPCIGVATTYGPDSLTNASLVVSNLNDIDVRTLQTLT